MVELGSVDMIVEVSTLASHMFLPHLRSFAYCLSCVFSLLVFDPSYPDIDKV